jgi:hypothetical protein
MFPEPSAALAPAAIEMLPLSDAAVAPVASSKPPDDPDAESPVAIFISPEAAEPLAKALVTVMSPLMPPSEAPLNIRIEPPV